MRTLLRLATACLSLLPLAATAQTYPSRMVRIVVPYAAGGGVDVMARALAERLSKKWGQPVVVDNKVGAATIIGADAVAKAPGDGYTLLLTSEATITSNPYLFEKLPYDTARDLAPISQLIKLPQMVVAHPSVPASSMADLVNQARARPNQLNYASYGSGSLPHLLFEGLKTQAGIEITQVPYKGIVPAMTALLSGEVQLTLLGVSLAQPHIAAGKMKALAVAGDERLKEYPELPTLKQAGLSEIDPKESWFGLFAPGTTPATLIAGIYRDVAQAADDPDFRQRILVARGFYPVFSSPESFSQAIQADLKQKARLIRISGAKAD